VCDMKINNANIDDRLHMVKWDRCDAMVFAERLKALRAEKAEKQQEIAQVLGITASAYGFYESGKNLPSVDALIKLARHFGVSTDYLLGRTDEKDGKKNKSELRIPVLGRIPAGFPTEAIQYVVDWEDLDSVIYNPQHEYFGLRVSGDSMYPTYQDGDVVIIQASPDAESGRDVVAIIDGNDATLKKMIKYEDGKVELRPINPSYRAQIFSPAEIASLPVKILGFVRELRRIV